MKYKTTIEVTCDAVDKDDAYDLAGEYLRGKYDSGVQMRCKTISIKSQRIAVCGVLSVIFVFALGVLGVENSSLNEKVSYSLRSPGTCTVMPELKTNNSEDFREKWETKKEKAILDYVKN